MRCAMMYRLHRIGLVSLAQYDVAADDIKGMRKLSDPFSSHTLINKRLSKMKLEGARVLDLGFGCAAIASVLRESGAKIDGVDVSPHAIAEFGHLFSSVHKADLNDLDSIPLEGGYDIILAADVLQFLVKPEEVLSKLKRHLVKGGLLVVALPNFVNVRNRVRILFGTFPKRRRGLIESQALHFYTLKGMERLLKRTGWIVVEKDVTDMPFVTVFPFMRGKIFRPVLWTVRGLTLVFRNLFAYQGVLFCTNPNEADLL